MEAETAGVESACMSKESAAKGSSKGVAVEVDVCVGCEVCIVVDADLGMLELTVGCSNPSVAGAELKSPKESSRGSPSS